MFTSTESNYSLSDLRTTKRSQDIWEDEKEGQVSVATKVGYYTEAEPYGGAKLTKKLELRSQ